MQPKWMRILWAGTAIACSIAASSGQETANKTPGNQLRVKGDGRVATIKGYVIDSSCTFRKHLTKPISAECAEKCARAGSPLVIQSQDGMIYLPISGEMPAAGQNEKLIQYAGKMVTVTGPTYNQGGTRAIVIEKIEASAVSQ
jgi:hypothetical protein